MQSLTIVSLHAIYRSMDFLAFWAYMWTNWYMPDRWELWAISAHMQFMRLRETNVLVKVLSFLYAYHLPRQINPPLKTHMLA